MGAIRLGRMYLRWCQGCNLPVLEEGNCPRCGNPTEAVDLTPPGEVRPAFQADLDLIREVANGQFGEGTGLTLLPPERAVLLNRIPGLDRMDEVLIDGQVVGTLRYDVDGRWVLVMRMAGARIIQEVASRGLVIADPGAVGPIGEGANMLAPGILEVHGSISPGEEVMVLTQDRRAIATGISRMDHEEMMERNRGMAVKTRWVGAPEEPFEHGKSPSWKEIIQANEGVIRRRKEEAVRFIKRTMEGIDLPIAVSFSGGKDSLACALLALEAGLRPPLIFVDTGLEFPETVEYVQRFAEEQGLELVTQRADRRVFERSMAMFGPPGRDNRWCCKTVKLGPTVMLMRRRFPSGVLSLIGQRRYESESRSEKPRVWDNPWTPGQVGAAPIQEWTSLHVWLYILEKGASYNPWYARGLDRIGCYMCPASDLGEMSMVEGRCGEFREWKDRLHRFAEGRGLPREWVDFGLWRWRSPPSSLMEELGRLGYPVEADLTGTSEERWVPSVSEEEGEVRASLPRELDLVRVGNLMNILGEVERRDGSVSANGTTVLEEGRIHASGDTAVARKRMGMAHRVVVKAMDCLSCGVCLGLCPEGALDLGEEGVTISERLCCHCGQCMEPCPVLGFRDDFDH